MLFEQWLRRQKSLNDLLNLHSGLHFFLKIQFFSLICEKNHLLNLPDFKDQILIEKSFWNLLFKMMWPNWYLNLICSYFSQIFYIYLALRKYTETPFCIENLTHLSKYYILLASNLMAELFMIVQYIWITNLAEWLFY